MLFSVLMGLSVLFLGGSNNVSSFLIEANEYFSSCWTPAGKLILRQGLESSDSNNTECMPSLEFPKIWSDFVNQFCYVEGTYYSDLKSPLDYNEGKQALNIEISKFICLRRTTTSLHQIVSPFLESVMNLSASAISGFLM